MIPVRPQPEPSTFGAKVRQPGLTWLAEKTIPLDGPAPPKTKWKDCWRECIEDLHDLYNGHCAYLATHLELATGEVTVDHFIPKKQRPRLAYEWSNYRLSSLGANRSMSAQTGIIDPFEVHDGWFYLELLTGRIFPNPALDPTLRARLQDTIKKLHLDNPRCRKLRRVYFENYASHCYFTAAYLQKMNPFVHAEAQRQGLL